MAATFPTPAAVTELRRAIAEKFPVNVLAENEPPT
jgi:hypothetical protein